MRRFGNQLADHAMDLFELLHQVGLRLQAAGRVDDADVGLRSRCARATAGERRPPGRPACCPFDDLDPQPIGPDRELLDGRGAERVAAPSTTFLPCERNMCASLAIDVVLPEPLTPTTRITVGPLAAKLDRLLRLREDAANLVLHAGQHVLHVNDASAKVGSDPVANATRRAGPHVGLHEDREQLAKKLVIDQPAFALEEIADVGVEDVARLLQRRAEHAEQALLRRLLRRTRGGAPLPCRSGTLAGVGSAFFLNRSKTPMRISGHCDLSDSRRNGAQCSFHIPRSAIPNSPTAFPYA